jgi:hypothetical protein
LVVKYYGHLPLTVICVMRPLCLSAAHFLLKQFVLNGHLSYAATNVWSPLVTDLRQIGLY